MHSKDSDQTERPPRVPIRSSCWCQSGRITLFGQIQNLSVGGCFVRTPTPLPAGSVASLKWEFEDDARTVDCVVRVAWARPADQANEKVPGMGLSFETINGAELQRIHSYISARTTA